MDQLAGHMAEAEAAQGLEPLSICVIRAQGCHTSAAQLACVYPCQAMVTHIQDAAMRAPGVQSILPVATFSVLLSYMCKTRPDQDQVGHLISLAGWNWCDPCLVLSSFSRAACAGPDMPTRLPHVRQLAGDVKALWQQIRPRWLVLWEVRSPLCCDYA